MHYFLRQINILFYLRDESDETIYIHNDEYMRYFVKVINVADVQLYTNIINLSILMKYLVFFQKNSTLMVMYVKF